MQPTLKRLITTKKEPTKKYITALSASQEAFCAEAAALLQNTCSNFETGNAGSLQAFSKFFTQLQLVLHAADTNAMLMQFKACLSARPTSNTLIAENHPVLMAIRVLCDLLFEHAPRAIVRELLRLLTYMMTPVGSETIDPISVCAFTRLEFMVRWRGLLQRLDKSASLSLANSEDTVDEATYNNLILASTDSDLLWSVFLSTLPSVVPLFEESDSSEILLCFLTRMLQHVSRDQQHIDISRQIFNVSTIESLLTSLHALLKLHPLRSRLSQDYEALITSCGLDAEAHVTQLWYEPTPYRKIVAAAAPAAFDDRYGGDSVRIVGSLLNAAISLLLSRNCAKDTTHSAGLFVAFLSTELFLAVGHHEGSWTQSQIVHTFFPSLSTSPHLWEFSVLNTLATGPDNNAYFQKWRFSPQFLDSLPQPALITIIRGLIVCFGTESNILTAPCAALPPISKASTLPAPTPSDASLDPTAPLTTPAFADAIPSSILFDALLPWFLKFSETSCERYARFLAVKSAGTCVEFLVKALDTLLDASHPDAVLNLLKTKVETSMDQLFELIWKNWEDPFDSIVSEIGNIFPLVLDAGEKAFKAFGASTNFGADFTDKLASHLLHVDIATKGKYPLLTLLIQRVGPARLLQLKPTFLEDLFLASNFALAGRAVGPAINAFILALHSAKNPAASGKKAKKGQNTKTATVEASASTLTVDPVQLITGPLANSLLKIETLVPISLYALPHIFDLFPECLQALITLLTMQSPNETIEVYDDMRSKAILSVLKVARSSGLIDNMDFTKPQFFGSNDAKTNGLLAKLVKAALMSNDINSRLDALQLMVETRKASELPTSMELTSLLCNIDHNMLETSLVYRNRSLNLLDQVLLRFKDSIKHHYKLPSRTVVAQQAAANDVKNAIAYLNEISSTLLHCLYIPAPPHRRFAALEGLKGLVGKFGPVPTKGSQFLPYIDLAFADPDVVSSKQLKISETSQEWKKLDMFSPAATLSLIAGLWDQYDAARVLSFDLLKLYPSPLPGFEATEALKPLLRWALSSINSPRMREADSGSLALRLIASSYIARSGWSVRMKMTPITGNAENQYTAELDATMPSATPSPYIERLVAFCNDISDIVLVHVAETRKNRKYAAMHFPVHGPLMAIRYIINDVNVAALDETSTKHWRQFVVRMMSVAKTVSDLALELKYPLRYTHNEHGEVDHSQDHGGAGDEGGDDDEILSEAVESNPNPSSETQQNKKEALVGGTTEGIIVAMWLSVKEVAFLLGCIVKTSVHAAVSEMSKSHPSAAKAPASSDSGDTESGETGSAAVSLIHPSLPLKVMTIEEISQVGQHILDTLLVLRHRGAMETTSEGFQLICETLLSTSDRKLHTLVSNWLAQLLDRIDNTPWALLSTRRSAGLPYAFIAILRSETVASDRNRIGRSMLPLVFAHLIATASRNGWTSQPTLASVVDELSQTTGEAKNEGYTPTNKDDADVGKGQHSNHSPKEHRHQVHALNVIRAIIRDRTVIDDISPYVEPILTLVLKLYHSPHWAVQNSATMAFSTLLERTAGGSRLANMASSSSDENTASNVSPPGGQIAPRVRAPKLQAADFFARYPIAHASLISSLSKATTTTTNSGFVARVFQGVVDAQQFPKVSELLSTISTFSSEKNNDASFALDESGEESASSSLYAVLLLLSRMTPSKVASTQRQSHVAPFVLLTCSAALSNANAMVRVLASKALAPLISTPSMPNFVKSMIDAIPNSPQEYAALLQTLGPQGDANQLHGLLTLILQLLRTHVPILISASQNPNQYMADVGSFNAESQNTSSNSDASFAVACSSQLTLLRNSILPSLINKLWILKVKIGPVNCALLSILYEFAVQPACASPSLLTEYPALGSLVHTTVAISSLLLKRKMTEASSTDAISGKAPIRAVMEDAMVHLQFKLLSDILVQALLSLTPHLDLSQAHIAGETVQSSLEALIVFPLYEVRLQVYKILTKVVSHSEYINKQTLAKKLLQQLNFLPSAGAVLETHPKCILRIIRLLNMLGEMGALTQLLKGSKEIVPEKVLSVLQNWAVYEPDAPSTGTPISRYCKTNTVDDTVTESGVSTSLRQESLAFLAFFLQNVQDLYSEADFSSKYLPMVAWWLEMVERHSRYELATTDRNAAVLSLSRHPLYFSKLAPSPQAHQLIVDYWMLVLRLLQDDDENTRETARTVVSTLMSTVAEQSRKSTSETAQVNLEPGLMVCTQYCFTYLSANAATLPRYWKWLISGLCPIVASESEQENDSVLQYWSKKTAFSTQLFEQEKANFFHEPVLVSQLCRLHVLKLQKAGSIDSSLMDMLRQTCAKWETNLVALVECLSQRVPKDPLVSDMHAEWQTMYDQIFAPLYCLVVGVQTCVDVLTSKTLSQATVTSLHRLIHGNAGTLHPVIAGVTYQLLDTIEPGKLAKPVFTFSNKKNNSSSETNMPIASPADTWHMAISNNCGDANFLLPHDAQ